MYEQNVSGDSFTDDERAELERGHLDDAHYARRRELFGIESLEAQDVYRIEALRAASRIAGGFLSNPNYEVANWDDFKASVIEDAAFYAKWLETGER